MDKCACRAREVGGKGTLKLDQISNHVCLAFHLQIPTKDAKDSIGFQLRGVFHYDKNPQSLLSSSVLKFCTEPVNKAGKKHSLILSQAIAGPKVIMQQ